VATKSCDGKSKDSGISQAAVQAFLAKKEMEKKKKAAEEEAAKRARIQERLAQSLGTKNAESAKGAKSVPTSHEGQCKPPTTTMNEQQSGRVNEKQKLSEHKASKTPHRQSSSRTSEADRKPTRPSLKPDSKNRDTKSKKPVEKVQKNPVNGKKGAPLNFKELLAAAERNKLGGTKLQSVVEQGNGSKKSGSNGESSNIKKRSLEEKIVKQDNTGKHKNTTVSTDSKRPSKSVPNGKSLPSGKDSSMKKDFKRSPGLVNGSREKPLEMKTKTSMGAISSDRKLGNPKYNNPAIERRPVKAAHLGQSRDRVKLKRKRNPYKDEMDDFIDDGEGEDVPDVSKYIREIFGYDKTRFNDAEDDLSYMETSYRQIEREEQKSAKIAKLEDEIEHLKELAELKKEKDRLKKKKKK